MIETPSFGFGGFLLGLGVGWLIFSNMIFNFSTFALLLIIIGGSMFLSGFLRWANMPRALPSSVSGAAGGLILALILTQGFSFLTDFGGFSTGLLPFTSEDTKTLSGALTDPSFLLKVKNINGPVTIETWDQKEYSVKLIIKARGASQKEADDHLTQFNVELVKQGSTLDLQYSYPDTLNPPYQISLTVKLPANTLIDLDVSSSNGAIQIKDVQGNYLTLATSNGPLTLTNIKVNIVKATTSNGPIDGSVDAISCTASTSNGPINLTLPLTQIGKYDLSTSNGPITIIGTRPAGYTIDSSSSNANINLNLPNLSYSDNSKNHKSAQTTNIDNYPIKIDLNLHTSNANIEVSTLASATY